MFSNFYPFLSLHCRSPEYWTWIHIWRHFGQLEANIYIAVGEYIAVLLQIVMQQKKCTRINRQLCKYENYALRHMMIHDIYVFSFSRGWCWMFWSTWPFLSIVWCLCSKIPSVIIHYLAKHIPADEWCLIIAFSVDYELLGWKISNMLHSGLIDVYDVLMFLGNLEHARGWENGVPRFFCFRNARN